MVLYPTAPQNAHRPPDTPTNVAVGPHQGYPRCGAAVTLNDPNTGNTRQRKSLQELAAGQNCDTWNQGSELTMETKVQRFVDLLGGAPSQPVPVLHPSWS